SSSGSMSPDPSYIAAVAGAHFFAPWRFWRGARLSRTTGMLKLYPTRMLASIFGRRRSATNIGKNVNVLAVSN
ncbi:hypothetical protein, partial [Ensifer sp. SSB1]|uniref:hypothetical protein n=1 Tax=Ensifer sp. SSB1 TaxID=2795385 RepID=UPI0025BC91A9